MIEIWVAVLLCMGSGIVCFGFAILFSLAGRAEWQMEIEREYCDCHRDEMVEIYKERDFLRTKLQATDRAYRAEKNRADNLQKAFDQMKGYGRTK